MASILFEEISNHLKNLGREMMSISELRDNVKDVNEIVKSLNSPLLIMVMGEFSTGKSTFINALVGKNITKVDAKPTTAVVTKLSYGTEDKITIFFRDGAKKGCDTELFARLTAEADSQASKLHEKIDYVERELPMDILKSMSIIDSPGLNSIKAVHEETTRRFMDKADTVLWMFDASNGAGAQTEIDALRRLNPRLAPIVLVNKMDAIDEEEGDTPEDILAEVEKRLSNNKLEFQTILGISARQALQGYLKSNEKLIHASNIGAFYDAVDTIVLPNREKYKRNSMLDGLAKAVFGVGNKLNEKRRENSHRKDTDYSAYVETESMLAASFDELENVADITMSVIEASQTTRRKRLNSAEKTFYGVLHYLGLFVEKNDEIAQQYLEEASVRNDSVAQHILVDVYSCLGQVDKASYWRSKLGLKDSSGQEMLDKGDSCVQKRNCMEAMEVYRKAADAGDVDAMCNIGVMYENGEGVARNYGEAIKWYRKAADAGNTDAMCNIGMMYDNGEGVVQDYGEAMKWYRKAADAGNTDAMYNIGMLYEEGEGVSQDYGEAMKWYRKAADAGDEEAMRKIGDMYGREEGVVQDYSEAMKWYQKAADTGDTDVMRHIGWLYKAGEGVMQDYSEAMKWYQKAADAGDAEAMRKIGDMYGRGEGVMQDCDKAIKWYRKAADARNSTPNS